jgi:fumarylpyruvate hydrolase
VQFEVELVVGLQSGGRSIPPDEALSHVYGYAVGLDMTRRDLQAEVLAKGLPWEATKAFDNSAPVGPITRVEDSGVLVDAGIRLKVNGEVKQDADINLMIWKIDEIVSKISEQHRLMPGDLIMTGTPAGVGAVATGDVLDCEVDGLAPLQVRIGDKPV